MIITVDVPDRIVDLAKQSFTRGAVPLPLPPLTGTTQGEPTIEKRILDWLAGIAMSEASLQVQEEIRALIQP